MEKHYITANALLLDSFKLAELIFQRGFYPDFIVGVWRGGAPVGIAVQEYLQCMGVNSDHIAIRTSSYLGIDKQDIDVKVYGLNYVIDNVSPEKTLLIVDDVFDSGRSVQAIIQEIHEKSGDNSPKTIKIACPWYKPKRNVTAIKPDYFVHATEKWLVFPHEINGLSMEEIMAGKGTEIGDIIQRGLQAKK